MQQQICSQRGHVKKINDRKEEPLTNLDLHDVLHEIDSSIKSFEENSCS